MTRNPPTPISAENFLADSQHKNPNTRERLLAGTAWAVAERDGLRKRLQCAESAYMDEAGVRRWLSNDAVVPPFVYDDALIRVPAHQQAAYDEETSQTLANYRAMLRARTPAQVAQDLLDIRAAFGPDDTVIDIITGETL